MRIVKTAVLALCCLVLLCSSAAAFIVGPTTTIYLNPTQDAGLPYDNEQQSGTNYGDYQYLMMASTNPGMAVLQFDVSVIPSSAIIDKAVLNLNIEQQEANYKYQVYKNTTAWSESSVSWNTRPDISQDSSWIHWQELPVISEVGMTSFVSDWMVGANNGITIISDRCQPLDGPPETQLSPTVYSREYADVSLRPLLTITYYIPAVPEPSSFIALLCGIGGMGGFVWRKRK